MDQENSVSAEAAGPVAISAATETWGTLAEPGGWVIHIFKKPHSSLSLSNPKEARRLQFEKILW